MWIIKRGYLWKISTGHLIDIWTDNWLVWTHKPDDCNVTLVSQLVLQDLRCWNEPLINSLFLPFEASQILQIPIPSYAGNDQLSWGPDKRGVFSVKSAYHCVKKWESETQSQSSSLNHDCTLWNKLWSLKRVPKHIHLAWRILHNSLPVRKKLIDRGVICIPLCPRCNVAHEDIDHTF